MLSFGYRYRGNFVRKTAFRTGACGLLLTPKGKLILILPADSMLVHQIFSGHAHWISAVHCLHFGIDKSPAKTGVKHLRISAKWFAAFAGHPRCTSHTFYSTGNKQISITCRNSSICMNDSRHPAGAKPVNRFARYSNRKSGK